MSARKAGFGGWSRLAGVTMREHDRARSLGGLPSPRETERPEYTGERCLPWMDDVQTVYEHLHRYLLACELAAGRPVLDVGCGEGYGSALLSYVADEVVGVDLDAETIEHARKTHRAGNLRFDVGSASELHGIEDASIGLVVCFEVIEHVVDHAGVLGALRRVLAADGVLLLSSPDREPYNDGRPANPFHVRELSREELTDMLDSSFPHVAIYDQASTIGSRMQLLADRGSAPSHLVEIEKDETGAWQIVAPKPSDFLLAVASPAPLPPLPSLSLLRDRGQELLARNERRYAEWSADTRRSELEEAARRHSAELAQVERRRGDIEAEVTRLSGALAAKEDELERLRLRSGEESGKLAARLAAAEREQEQLRMTLSRMAGSRGWRALKHLRGAGRRFTR